jgi:alanyl-tRNA synthetase
MHPLVPYLMGESHPSGQRLVNIQKCVRTDDIDEVGDPTHNTFFEMLGNWSLGEYFKKESIEWSWEFLTSKEWLGIDPRNIAVSVFEGDADAPKDNESAEAWLRVSGGKLEGRIDFLPKAKNWWGPAGITGPCGTDTEMFFWVGADPAPAKITPGDLADHPQWVEIWNNVFMQYNKTAEGKFEPLAQKNVDTGMGLERTLAIVNGVDNIYETDLFKDIVLKIEELSGKNYKSGGEITKAIRIVADHLRAAVFIVGDDMGAVPSNTKQGYIVRRLIRRAIRYGKILGIENDFTKQLAEVVIRMYGGLYVELERNRTKILEELEKEEDKFRKTLEKGLKEFEKLQNITGNDAFNLYQTYGFPLEMTVELAKEKGLEINKEEFEKEFQKHQDLSRTASAGMFKGGLADTGEASKKYHTATHLLLAALREVLGAETYQKGSNINAERLRFDFNYSEKLTAEQLKQIEDLVNQKIQEKLPVEMMEMSKDEALKLAKVSFDPAKYGDVVKVYKIDDYSVELCGGPHVSNTSELGKFKITKEEASSAGVRRIKAVLE